jgi:hypothetical protein
VFASKPPALLPVSVLPAAVVVHEELLSNWLLPYVQLP